MHCFVTVDVSLRDTRLCQMTSACCCCGGTMQSTSQPNKADKFTYGEPHKGTVNFT